jgi:hypothetical protein
MRVNLKKTNFMAEENIFGLHNNIMDNGSNLKYLILLHKMHGNGICVWKDGRKYIGQYKNGQKHGYG